MKPTPLTNDISVSAQISPDDVPVLASEGFRTIINNRPDGEADDQPPGDDIRAAAEAAGLTYHHIPFVPNRMTSDVVDAFASALDASEKPVLAFCRTGNRSTMAYKAMNQRRAAGRRQGDADDELGFGEVVFSTLAAAFGVQTRRKMERDLTHGEIFSFIAAGLIFTVAFVVTIITIVNLVTGG